MSEELEGRLTGLEEAAGDLARRVELLEHLVKDLVLRGDAPAARPAAARPARGVEGRWLAVRVAGRRLGLPIEQVREVVRSAALGPVPGGSRTLEGLLDLRGEPVEVVDLRAALGAPALDDDLDARLVVTRADGARSVAFKVDEALGLVRVAAGAVEPAPELTDADYLVGVVRSEVAGEPPLLLLEPGRLIASLAAGEDAAGLSPETPDERGSAWTNPA